MSFKPHSLGQEVFPICKHSFGGYFLIKTT